MKALDRALSNPIIAQKISDYLRGKPVTLDSSIMVVLNRLDFMDNQIRKYYARNEAIAAHKRKFPDISHNQAVEDYWNAKHLFNSFALDTKDYDFHLIEQAQWELYRMCIEDGDKKTAQRVLDSLQAAVLTIRKEKEKLPEIPAPAIILTGTDPNLLGDGVPTEAEVKKLISEAMKVGASDAEMEEGDAAA